MAARGLTLADATAAVGSWTDLPVERQRTIISSLNLIARSAGLPPAAAALTVPFVQKHLVDRTPAALGIGAASRDIAVCDGLHALVRLGLIDPEPETLAPGWLQLLARSDARCEPSRARALYIRFAKFATLRRIDPTDVDDAVFADFTDWVVTPALIARPTRIAGTFRRTRNEAVTTEPGWPQAPLVLPPRGADYVVPLEKSPASFQADIETFRANRAANDRAAVFDGDGPPARAAAPALAAADDQHPSRPHPVGGKRAGRHRRADR